MDAGLDGHVWYFAYGSNMSPAIFRERRGMEPLETHAGFVDGYRLAFDIPVGPGERAVANVALDAAARIHGVAYLLSAEDAERLDRTEGVPRVYQREPVTIALTRGATCAGFTYRSSISVAGRKPSARYLGLLLDGARAHGLPETYVAALATLQLAVDERLAETE
jgi:cation transport regulator ChaC